MANVNISKVHLLNVPLENDYKHTLYFENESAQENYFKSRIIKSYEDFSYQRKDNYIRVPDHFDNLQNVNYVMYQNTAYSNKWFYGFVTDVVYIDDGRTDIYIETDYIQTWFFNYTVKSSFVEREHVTNDTPGNHTVPEQIEHGEFIVNSEFKFDMYGACEPVIAVTELPGGNDTDKQVFNQYNGLFQGCAFITGGEEALLGNFGGVSNIIKHYVDNGKADSIVAIFMCPKILLQGLTYITKTGWKGTVTFGYIPQSPDTWGATMTPQKKPTKLDGYTPRNKKLLTYPYCYLNMDNNTGNCVQYHYEHFELSDEYYFSVDMALVPGISTKIYPNNYQGLVSNYHYATTGAKLPICSWASDVYTNWLTQNSVNLGISVAGGVSQVVLGALSIGATGGGGALFGAGMITGGVQSIANTLGQAHQHSFIPPSLEGNLNSGDVNYGLGLHNPILYQMSIKQEYAKIIDGFFDMFGYKVNMVKVPNKNHRPQYWYTKTIDVNIDGAIPNKDMQKIKDCYNNGITFWKNPANIQNYSVTNTL